MSNDLKEKKVLPVTEPMILEGNFHNTTILYRGDGKRFLALPDNEKHRVYIISDEGKLSSILHSPMDLNDYYAGGGAFNPTDTEYADGRLYVADGYSAGNYISIADPWSGSWTDEYFGGKATKALEYGLLGRLTGSRWNPTRVVLRLPTEPTHAFKMWIFTGRFWKMSIYPKGPFLVMWTSIKAMS